MSKRFQPIGAEIEGNLKLLELQLENVEGGKMEVAFVFFTLVVIIQIDPLNSQIIFIKIKKKNYLRTCSNLHGSRCMALVLSTGLQAGKSPIWSRRRFFRSSLSGFVSIVQGHVMSYSSCNHCFHICVCKHMLVLVRR